MAQFGNEPDIQVVHARGIIKDHAPPCWRSGNEVGVVHSEFSAVSHEDVERDERLGILQIADFSDVQRDLLVGGDDSITLACGASPTKLTHSMR